MGWFFEDHHGHEGYVVAVEKDDWSFRELHGDDATVARARSADGHRIAVKFFQVGCDCGWRSTRYAAPSRAYWSPSILELCDEQLEDACREEWCAHVKAEVKRALDHREREAWERKADANGWARPMRSDEDFSRARLAMRTVVR
jgi:hypothetical protein